MKTRFFFAIALIALVLGTVMSVAAQRALPSLRPTGTIYDVDGDSGEKKIQIQDSHDEKATTVLPPPQEEQDYITARALRRYTQTEILTQVVKNVEISVANFQVDDNVATVYVCYQMPEFKREDLNQVLSNWVIYQTELKIGKESFVNDEAKLFEYSTKVSENENLVRRNPEFLPGNDVKTEEVVPGSIEYECRRLSFIVNEADISTTAEKEKVSLIIHSMYTSPREGQSCTFYGIVEQELRTQGREVAVECVEEGGASTRKTIGMNEKGFWDLVWSEFLTYKGPWEFNIPWK